MPCWPGGDTIIKTGANLLQSLLNACVNPQIHSPQGKLCESMHIVMPPRLKLTDHRVVKSPATLPKNPDNNDIED
jgi:hypothetical protein